VGGRDLGAWGPLEYIFPMRSNPRPEFRDQCGRRDRYAVQARVYSKKRTGLQEVTWRNGRKGRGILESDLSRPRRPGGGECLNFFDSTTRGKRRVGVTTDRNHRRGGPSRSSAREKKTISFYNMEGVIKSNDGREKETEMTEEGRGKRWGSFLVSIF